MPPRKPNTPAVSDASMCTWMGYLHLQYPIDGMYHNESVIGVPVSIDTIDPNGNAIHIANVTSDISGTFSYTWTPKISGDYKITATFTGTSSYGSSWAETHANVVNAQATTTPVELQAVPDYTMTTLATGIGIALVVIIAAISIILTLRKR
jgi:hypothetical protein